MISIPYQSDPCDNNDAKVVPTYDSSRQSFQKPQRKTLMRLASVARFETERVPTRIMAGANFNLNQSSLRLNTGNIKKIAFRTHDVYNARSNSMWLFIRFL